MLYDAAGYVYEYDYENRLTKIEDSGSSDVAAFAYDALGRRIEKIAYESGGNVTATITSSAPH